MTDLELEALLADLGSDRVERMQSLADKDKIRQAACAFANDLPNHQAPGVLFAGATDDGSCAGLPIAGELLLSSAHMRSDGNIRLWSITSILRRHRGCITC
jgi:ATP-dependent DNA helicase RecG